MLDSLRVVGETDVSEYLSPRLLAPAADDVKWPYLRFVVVGRPSELETLGTGTKALAKELTIKPFKRPVVGRLAREAFALSDLNPNMDLALQMIETWHDDVMPADLSSLVRVIGLQAGGADI